MGKLSIIPRRDIRDNALGEEERATATTTTTYGAATRSSADSGAIVRNADRDYRFPIVDGENSRSPSTSVVASLSRRCAETEESPENRRPIVGLLEVAANSTAEEEFGSGREPTCRQQRWHAGRVVVGAARPRRNTWHADRAESERATSVTPSGSRLLVDDDAAREKRPCAILDAPCPRAFEERRWNAKLAVSLARRATRADPDSIRWRMRRGCDDDAQLPTRGESVDAPTDIAETRKILRGTVDSITAASNARQDRDRFCVPLIGTADVSDGDITSDGVVNNGRVDVDGGSPITVLETRESIDNSSSSSINAERIQARSINYGSSNSSNSSSSSSSSSSGTSDPANDPAASSSRPSESAVDRPIEIGIVDPSYRTRALADETLTSILPSALIGRTIGAIIDPDGRSPPKRNKTDTSCPRSSVTRIGRALRALLFGLLAMCLFCDAALGAPSSSIDPDTSIGYHRNDLEDVEMLATTGHDLGDDELEIIRRSIVQGLGLKRLPDPSKANVSQAEYERAHREYLKQVQLSSHDGQESRKRRSLHVFEAAEYLGNNSSFADDGNWRGNHRHSLYFPVTVPDAEDITVDHASLRFFLLGDHRFNSRDLEILIYLRTPVSRRLLLRRRILQMEPKDSRWLELDSTEAAASWLEGNPEENYGLELEFLHDGRPTQREISHVKLNVFVASNAIGGDRLRRKRSTPEELMPLHKGRRSKCKGDNNKKCCRHELTVMFKDLKGFDFIVYPKGFDAGYCKGRCPPRYNPAHHHALLQSLLWKEDRKRVPKPCCAPSKLDQLMIVYFDENDSTQLKVSYWKNIQVLECACS